MDRNDVLNLKDPPDGAVDQVINAAIMAGQGFFSTLAGLAIAQIRADPMTCLVAAAIVAGLEFFGTLAIQRGLAKKPASTEASNP